MKKALLVLSIVALLTGHAWAADKYWDINGATAGAGGATPAGTWDTGTTANWNTSSAGTNAATTWAAADKAIFAAGGDATGSYNVTISSTGSPHNVTGGVLIEEGNVNMVQSASSAINIGTGTVTINSGATMRLTLTTTITHTAGGGGVQLDGGTLQNINTGAAGTFYSTNAVIHLGALGGTLKYDVANTLNIMQAGNNVDGVGSLTKTGVGVLAMASAATHTGGTFILDGELRMRTTANRLPIAGAVTVTGPGILNLNNVSTQIGSLTGTGNVGTGSGTLTINGSTSTVFDGALKNIANAGAGAVTTGNGSLVKQGSSTITFNGVNDINGSVTLTAGGITVAALGSLCGDICDVTVNGGLMTLNQATEKIENLGGTGGTINLNNAALSLVVDPASTTAANVTYTGIISGAGGITKTNANNAAARTETLGGANTYNGNTFVINGTLSVQNATALGNTVGFTEVNQSSGTIAAELLFTTAAGSVITSEPLRIKGIGGSDNGVIAVTAGATPTISGAVTLIGDSTVTVSGTSTVTFNNASAFTSAANESLTLTGGSGVGGGGTISGAISLGTGSLTKLQGGTWTLSNAAGNSYSGGTVMGNSTTTGGTLAVTNTSGSGTGSGNISIGNLTFTGTLNVGNGGAGGSVSGDIAFVNTSNTSTVNFNRTVDLAYAGAISGANGVVNKLNTNTLTFTGANTYGGNTTVSGGTLLANNATGSATGTGNVAVGSSATLGGTGAVSGAVTVNDGGTLSPGASIESLGTGAVTFNSSVTGGSTFKYELNSTLLTADLLNAATGSLTISTTGLGVTLALSDLGASLVPDGTKFTLISYNGTLNTGGMFAGLPELGLVTVGPKQFRIRYKDATAGGNFTGETALNTTGRFVTLTAVPELGSFITMGLVGCCAMGANWIRKRYGFKALSL